jgi:hypothetical protein
MNRRLPLILAAFALICARRASAQETAIGYQGLPYKVVGESPTGINLSEGVLLHLGLGAEAGYDSNVFYGSSSVPGAVIGSGLLRFTGFGEISNGGHGVSPGLTYDVRAGLTYRYYTSDNVDVKRYSSAFMPTAGLSLSTIAGEWALSLSDTFARTEDPPYLAGSATQNPISRDNNLATAQAAWSPGGGRITTTLRYTNSIDIFEQDSGFSYANSLTHMFMLDVSWKWLPKTAIFLQAQQGYISYLNTNSEGKVPSYPLHVIAGLRGLVTPKLSAVASLGYGNAFYSSGVTTAGFWGSSYVDLQGILTPSLLNRLTVGYHQDFMNSVISNFYYSYSVYAAYVHQIAGRVSLDLSLRYSYLDYQGLLFDKTNTRVDNTIYGGLTLDYFVRSWIYAGVGYSLVANFSDYHLPDANGNPDPTKPVDYVKHQVFARLGVTY